MSFVHLHKTYQNTVFKISQSNKSQHQLAKSKGKLQNLAQFHDTFLFSPPQSANAWIWFEMLSLWLPEWTSTTRWRLYACTFSAKRQWKTVLQSYHMLSESFDRQQCGNSIATAVARRCLQTNMWTNAFKETKHAGSTIEAFFGQQPETRSKNSVSLQPWLYFHHLTPPGTTQPPGAKGWNPMAPGAPCCLNMKLSQFSPMWDKWLKWHDWKKRTSTTKKTRNGNNVMECQNNQAKESRQGRTQATTFI